MQDPASKIADGIRRQLAASIEDDEDLLERAEEVVLGLEKGAFRISQIPMYRKYLHPEIEVQDGVVIFIWSISLDPEVVYSSKTREASARLELFVPRTGQIRVKMAMSYDSLVTEPHEWAMFEPIIEGLLASGGVLGGATYEGLCAPGRAPQSVSNTPADDTDA